MEATTRINCEALYVFNNVWKILFQSTSLSNTSLTAHSLLLDVHLGRPLFCSCSERALPEKIPAFPYWLMRQYSVAVWSFDKRIMVLLFLLSLGHWAIIFRGKPLFNPTRFNTLITSFQIDVIVTHASWNDEAGTCVRCQLFTTYDLI